MRDGALGEMRRIRVGWWLVAGGFKDGVVMGTGWDVRCRVVVKRMDNSECLVGGCRYIR